MNMMKGELVKLSPEDCFPDGPRQATGTPSRISHNKLHYRRLLDTGYNGADLSRYADIRMSGLIDRNNFFRKIGLRPFQSSQNCNNETRSILVTFQRHDSQSTSEFSTLTDIVCQFLRAAVIRTDHCSMRKTVLTLLLQTALC